ncbi:hypothetical protein Cgig2_011602 [Carnegiea gigantea]|uniref:Reverse transcriptase zinc-binding domain-containing protein n=1 Tax=Carnegiea gigantea TaxID=171969 RepID=A0A9Q1GLI1_9CARY|nr:hypothetical protein Cgig2_011602 [Carnegiea gigantea]
MGITLTQPGEIYGMHSSPLLLIWMRPGVYWGISTRFSNQGTKWRRGTEIQEFEVKPFAERIASCELQELQHHGPYFTWTNKTTWSRIDRVFINTLWYNHTPMVIETPHCPIPPRLFHFCDTWIKDPRFLPTVSSQLPHCPRPNPGLQIKSFFSRVKAGLLKSKADWIGYGDDCTGYFFAQMRQRKVATYIHDLHDDKRHLHFGFLEVSTVLQNYYKTLLGPNSMDRSPIDPKVINIGNTLPINLQMQLCAPFSTKDIKESLFTIPNLKSLGPDGFGSGFFKATWQITGELEVIDQISQLSRNYLWTGSVDYKRIPYISRNTMCSPKKYGGLGLKNLAAWNKACIACIAKLVWFIAMKKDILWVKWVHGKAPVKQSLGKFTNQTGELLCGLCNEEEETLEHLFLSCSWAKELWYLLSSWWPIPHFNPTYDSFLRALKRMKGT